MGMRTGDLVDNVLSKISIDEFEPKTGESKDVVVLGFFLNEQSATQDLYNFINSSVFEIRDAETSPNPNEDGYYMLFIEVDRSDNLGNMVNDIVRDIKNVAGDLRWQATTHLTDDYFPIDSDQLAEYLITDPEKYMTREEFEQQRAEQQEQQRQTEQAELAESNSQAVLDFLRDSSLLEAGFSDTGLLTMMAKQGVAQFEIISFGDAESALAEAGIDQSPILESDYNTRVFNSMLGDLNAVKISEYVVVFNTNTKQALVGKPC